MDLEGRVVWCNGHNGDGAGRGPGVETRVRDANGTNIAGGGAGSEKADECRARRDDMMGENGCLQNTAWRINTE